MNFAVIKNSTVVNVIVAEPGFELPEFELVASEEAGIGWSYRDGQFFPPEPEPTPIPEEVEGWQAEVAMRLTPVDPDDPESQNVWDRVQDIIAAMPDGPEKVTAQIVLQRGKIRRDSPMLAQLAPMVPLTEEQVDDLLRLAASIQA